MGRASRVRALAALVGVVVGGVCAADVVRMKDGREFEGKITGETAMSVTIDAKIANIRTTLTLDKAQVREIERRPLADGFFDAPERSTRESAPADEVDEEQKAPARERAATDFTPYIEIPLVGMFGRDIIPAGIEESLRYASRRGVRDIVFTIKSPGGYVWAADDIAEILKEHAAEFRYRVIIEEAISASIWLVFSCDEIFVKPGATIGAAVVFSQDSSTGEVEVDKKMNSAIAGKIAALAESNGHPGALARAMIVSEAEAWRYAQEDGSHLIRDEAPADARDAEMVDGPSTVLTLTARDAVRIGLARMHTGDADSLGGLIEIPGWRRMSDFGAAAMRRAKEEHAKDELSRENLSRTISELAVTLGMQIDEAVTRDPENNRYVFDGYGMLTPASRREWRSRTEEAIEAWGRVIDSVDEIRKLKRKIDDRADSDLPDLPDLGALRDRAGREIDRLHRNRNKNSV